MNPELNAYINAIARVEYHEPRRGFLQAAARELKILLGYIAESWQRVEFSCDLRPVHRMKECIRKTRPQAIGYHGLA